MNSIVRACSILVLASAWALPAAAQETPHGSCIMKAIKQEQADRKACNDKHGSTVTPERSACFKKVDGDRKAANKACDKQHPKK